MLEVKEMIVKEKSMEVHKGENRRARKWMWNGTKNDKKESTGELLRAVKEYEWVRDKLGLEMVKNGFIYIYIYILNFLNLFIYICGFTSLLDWMCDLDRIRKGAKCVM